MSYRPPYRITPLILGTSQQIARALGILVGQKVTSEAVQLRRSTEIKTIQASLAIEGNTLSLAQVTDLLEGKRVVGPPKDILEVKNAIKVYARLGHYNPLNVKDLLAAHALLMQGLVDDYGIWRRGGVGIFKGRQLRHLAPPAKKVPTLMKDLFSFLKSERDLSWLIKACVFHYEFEFIHPFSDGNGRMGRLWHQLILMKEDPVFALLPVEVVIKKHQQDYYQALQASDRLADTTPFIEFSLAVILSALEEFSKTLPLASQDAHSRLHYARTHFSVGQWFSRKDYLTLHREISTATASRDLLAGIAEGSVVRKGEKNQTVYKFADP